MSENSSINDRIAQLIAEMPGAASGWKMLEGFTSIVLVKDELCFTWQPGSQLSFSTPGKYEKTASIELSETRATEILSSVCRQIFQMCATGKFELDYLEEDDQEEEQDEYEDEHDDELE